MERYPMWLIFLALVIAGSSAAPRAVQRERTSAPQQQRAAQPGAELILTGEVVAIHAPRLFTIRERAGSKRELLVLAPRALSAGFVGATITVKGALQRFGEAELRRYPGWAEIDERTRERFRGNPVIVAGSLMAIAEGEAPPPGKEPPAPAPAPAPAVQLQPVATRGPQPPLTVRAGMLVAHLDEFAGRRLRILNGRVVGVVAPDVFLIEPATSYLKPMGRRDRMVVLIESATLRAPAALLVGSTVTLTGTARTLVGIQVTREVPWPDQLRPDVVERWEVRAAVLATSVQTADGIELTTARPPGQ